MRGQFGFQISGRIDQKLAYVPFNIVPDLAEDRQLFLARPKCRRWVFKAPPKTFVRERKHRAALLGHIAHFDDISEMLFKNSGYIFGVLAGNVDLDFVHYLDGEGIDRDWLYASAHGGDAIAS